MNIVGKRLHIGEFFIWVEYALRVAFTLPGVVDVHVDVASIAHSGGNECIGCIANCFVIHFFGEIVPTVPSHWRSGSQLGCLRSKKERCEKYRGQKASHQSHDNLPCENVCMNTLCGDSCGVKRLLQRMLLADSGADAEVLNLRKTSLGGLRGNGHKPRLGERLGIVIADVGDHLLTDNAAKIEEIARVR